MIRRGVRAVLQNTSFSHIHLRKNGLSQHRMLQSRQHSSYAGSSWLTHRDVFVFDRSMDLLSFLQKHGRDSRSIMHPQSPHAIAKYADFIYNNSTYNFNSLGEFSLSICAAEVVPNKHSTDRYDLSANRSESGAEYAEDTSSSANEKSSHSVFVWPEKLLLHGVTANEIPKLGALFLKDEPISIASLRDTLPSGGESVRIVSGPQSGVDDQLGVVVFAVGGAFTAHRAQQTAQQLADEFATYRSSSCSSSGRSGSNANSVTDTGKASGSNSRQKVSLQQLQCWLTSEFTGSHRNAAHVMVLPFEDCFEDLPDASFVAALARSYSN